MKYRFAQGRRAQLRLPLSPFKAEMALKALEDWRAPAEAGAERTWYRIANQAAGGVTQVNIFDEISWWGISAQQFADELAGITGAIEVHINSPGGDAFDGITIYNALASRPGVTTVVDGLAASAASVIAMAGQTRVMSPGSMMMIHDALALCIGNAADMREVAGQLDKVSDNIASVYAAHAGKTAAEWRQSMVAEGWYTAQEAVDAGLAHKVAERPGSGPGDPEASFDRKIFAGWYREPGRAPAVRAGADVDDSEWDAGRAWAAGAAADDPAAFYDGICAGKKAGDPATQDAHALPYRYEPDGPPNADGVRNALARLPQTEGLTNEAQARSTLEAAMKKVNPDWSPDDLLDTEFLAYVARELGQLDAGRE